MHETIIDSTMEPILPVLQAVGKIPSGVFILTAGQGPTATGTLVSFVQQVSIEPLNIAVALRTQRSIIQVIEQSRRFVLHVVPAGDKTLLRKFARGSQTGDEAFTDLKTRRLENGGTLLLDACAYLDCQLAHVVDFNADHRLLIASVLQGELLGNPPGKPMLHLRHDGSNY